MRLCVRPSVRASTLSNMNISETSRQIATKFYLKHHWGGGKAALGFDADQIRTLVSETSRQIATKFYLKHHWGGGKAALGFDADQIRTLVSMATDSSHRVIMGKRASSRFLDCF